MRLAVFFMSMLIGCGSASEQADSDDPAPTGTDTDVPTTDTSPPADTWDNFAEDFFATYCVACHTGDGKDFRRYDRVLAAEGPTRCGVSPTALPECSGFPPPGQFPVGPGPFPSDAERVRLVQWFDDGALEGAL